MDSYRRGRDPYELADDAGYGGRDEYAGAVGYDAQEGYGSQDGYGRPDRYATQAAYEQDDGHDEPDEYGWPDATGGRDSRDDATPPRRRGGGRDGGGRADGLDDDSRHEGFFRGFGQDDDDLDRRRRRPREHRSHAGLIALSVVLAIVLGIAYTGYHFYSEYQARHASYTGSGFGSVTVIVKPGDTPDLIAPELLRLHVIEAIDPWAAYVQDKIGLQPGEFKLHEHMSPAAAWAMLTNPKSRVNSTVTIPDGLRVSKILPLLASKSGIPLSKFESAIKDTAALGLPAWANGNPEGFLYPDTYDIVPGSTTALQILQDAVHQFNVVVTQLNLAVAAPRVQFTEMQVLTEASLLEAEVQPQYYGQVARVIDNRLNLGMDLGLDSTVAYATGKYIYNLSSSDLQVNSPYNTFIHSNLPPGPIDSPDQAAIEAVLHPAQGNWVYFVTVNKSGLTEFTASNSQFQTWSNEARQNGV